MSKLEKFGLMLILLGTSIFREGGTLGGLGVLLVIGGYMAFLFGEDAPNTVSHTDGARCVCDKCGQPHDPKLIHGGPAQESPRR